jgi:hypothetical protein
MRGRLLGLTIALHLAAPRSTEACSCAAYPLLVPPINATGVPINTRIWVTDRRRLEPPRLIGPRGEVPTGLGQLRRGEILNADVLTPQAPLEPDTTYTVASHDGTSLGSFTTGRIQDTDPPALPRELLRTSEARLSPGSSCGYRSQRIELDVAWQDVFLLAHLTTGAPPPSPDLRRPRTEQPDLPYLFSEASGGASTLTAGARRVSIGRSACMNWPAGMDSGRLWLGTLDAAGNFSGWQDSGRIDLPPLPPDPDPRYRDARGGCRMANAGGATGPGSLLALGLLLLAGRTARTQSREAGRR